MSLKDCKETTYSSALEYLSIIIAKEFKRHKSLLLHDEIDEDEKSQFRTILKRKASEAELGTSLQFLTELLSPSDGKQMHSADR